MKPLQINVRFDDTAAQWVASFVGDPCVAYGADFSVEAARRLLEGTTELDKSVDLIVEQVDGTELRQRALWQVPDLLLQCSQCDGKGEYIGLTTKETCPTCRGFGFESPPGSRND